MKVIIFPTNLSKLEPIWYVFSFSVLFSSLFSVFNLKL